MAALSLNRIRAEGRVVLGFAADEGVTRLARLGEGGGYRVKFPVQSGPVEAVMVNTGGGMTGGDHLTVSVEVGEGASASFTTPAAEKIYAAVDEPRASGCALSVGAGGRLLWVPQEQICSTRRGSRAVLPLIWPRMRALFWPRALSSGASPRARF